MSVCYETSNMLPSSVSTSSSSHLLNEPDAAGQSSPLTAQSIVHPPVIQPEAPQIQTAKGIAKLVVTNHPAAPLLQKAVNPPLITVLNPSGPLTVVKTLCVTSGVPSAPHFTLVNSAPLTVTNAAVKSPTITLLSAPVTVVKALGAGPAAGEKGVVEAPVGVGVIGNTPAPGSAVVENRGHNVFVKNSCPDSTVSDMPQSHKLLTANNFPAPNVLPAPQPKTLNGQKGKVKIVSNVLVPGTSQLNNNVLLNKTNQQRYVPRQKAGGLNGATPRYLNKPSSLGAIKPTVNHAMKLMPDDKPPNRLVHKGQIKTIPPVNSYGQKAQQSGIKTISPQRKNVPGQVQRTGSGLRTIPPQRAHRTANKPNYIGKHAAQAHKTRQAHGKVKGAKALTAQIIETLSNNSGAPMPGGRYEMLPMRYDNAFSCPDLKQIPEPNKLSEDKNKSGLDALSLICQAVLLDHNYNATLPPDSPTRPPPMNIMSPQINGIPLPTMYSPGAAKTVSCLTVADHFAGRPLPAMPVSMSSAAHLSSTSHHPAGLPPAQGNGRPSMALRRACADDDAASDISDGSEGRRHDTEGEETDTAPEAEAVSNENFEGYGDYVTRCICTFVHDDGYMVECDRCKVWQHVQCVVKNRQVPDEYLCEVCDPTKVIDRQKARALQQQWLKDRQFVDPKLRKDAKAKEIFKPKETVSDTDSSDGEHVAHNNNVVAKGRTMANRRKNDNGQKQAARQRREVAKEVVQRRQKRKERKTVRKKQKPTAAKPASEDDQHAAAAASAAAAEGWAAHLPQLRQWIEKYEEAVTNHYSPELRARISSVRVNGAHSGGDMHFDASVQKCRVHTQPLTELKYLVSTANLDSNTPVVELRGKYMLSAQHRNSGGSLTTRQHSQRPGPFLFFYRLAKDNTEVCVDTRTYGNSARFVRRSCRPNAELRHCIEKGALHIYLVTLTGVEKNGELTIKHETHDLAAIGTTSIACACGHPDECFVNKSTVKKNGDSSEMTGRKRRGRRTISSSLPEPEPPKPAVEELLSPTLPNLPVPALPSPVMHSPGKIKLEKLEKLETVVKMEPVEPAETKLVEVKVEIDIKEEPLEVKVEVAEPAPEVKEKPDKEEEEEEEEEEDDEYEETKSPRSNPVTGRRSSQYKSDKDDEKSSDTGKETKKEKCKKLSREERKLEAILRAIEQMEKAESRKQEHQAKQAHRRESEPGPGPAPGPKEEDRQEPKVKQRRRRKGRSRTVSQSARRNRLNSTDSYMTSGDENMLLSPNDHPHAAYPTTKAASPRDAADRGGGGGDTRAVGLLLALSNGEPTVAAKEPKSPDSNSNSAHSSPETRLSSACLLVQAAVEPLEQQGFKFPKTKKGLMNEWLNKVPEPVQAASSTSPSFVSPVVGGTEDGACTPTKSAGLTQTPASCGADVQPRGSAKKRWLRQAISEDHSCERPDSPPLSDMVAPPKKRRLPRESLSTDTSPPNTPTSTVPPTNPMNDSLNMEGCVEIVYNAGTEGDSPPESLESDAVLKERAAKMRQEFAGSPMRPVELSRFDPRLSRDSQMFGAHADLVGTVEKTLSILGLENGEKTRVAVPPAPKRKLSISEYRQRKKLNPNDRSDEADQEVEPTSTEENNSSESFKVTARARSVSSSSSTSLSSSDEELLPLDITAKAPAFNSEPTELERQRELASLRLKKVLGLNVEEPRPVTALNIETIVNLETETKPATLPFPSPTFPIPGAVEVSSTDGPPLDPPQQLLETPEVCKTETEVGVEETKVERMETEDIPATEESQAIDQVEGSTDAQPNPVSPGRQEVEGMEEEEEEEEEEEVAVVPSEPAFEEAESVSYVPPFNNPVYPNESFTNYSSTIDDELRYEGRNPSPPPNLEKAESSGES
ncbi:unnamed protein product [Phaedon cochleariae]|uniref:SET domain-containing protein n=1 Tax=Phaedon cochleariae TaxID=80249 RepID=A0A9N9SJK5_PHACE|nr:unnamed protein product [Phaedon cochleariae]